MSCLVLSFSYCTTQVHKFLNLKRASILKLFDVKMFKEGSKLQKEFGGNATEGDGMVLGGLFMMDKSGKCTYEYRQTNFREDAPISEVSVIGFDHLRIMSCSCCYSFPFIRFFFFFRPFPLSSSLFFSFLVFATDTLCSTFLDSRGTGQIVKQVGFQTCVDYFMML